MNAGASNVVVQGFLKGVFDVFDAMLPLSFTYDITEMDDLTPDARDGFCQQYPVVMQGKVKGQEAALAILLTVEDASRFVALLEQGEATAKAELDESDTARLREIAEASLGGGISHLKEKLEKDLALERIELVQAGGETPAALGALLGDNVTAASFRFSAGEMDESNAVLLFSQGLEAAVPEELVNLLFGANSGAESADGGAGLAANAQLSESEMSDILSGFGAEEESGLKPAPSAEPGKVRVQTAPPVPTNLGMVLDIELEVTARLGRIEMPIGEILSLGPGSIFEVGHLVDEPVELLVNDKLIARGDVVVVDEKFGIRITEIVSPRERIESLR